MIGRPGFKNRCVRFVLVAVVTLLGVAGIVGTNGDNGVDASRRFTLAFVDTDWKLRIRWSEDGTGWLSASGGAPSIDRAPGIAANDAGTLYLAVFQDSLSNARMMMGVGPATWDNTPTLIGDGHASEIDSGTSVVHVDGTNWLVAFTHQNRAKVVPFDSSTSVSGFGAEVTPVSGVVNNNLIDRPALVNRDGRLIVSWLMSDQLQMVTADVQAGQPVWQAGYLFSANVTEQGFGPPVGAHDLAHDGQDFYAAVVRRRDELPDEAARHYFLFIYTSNNGLNWTELTYREVVRIPHSMSIAARGPDDLIAMVSYAYDIHSGTQAYRFDGSNWTLVDADSFFGSHPMNNGHDFTLFAKD